MITAQLAAEARRSGETPTQLTRGRFAKPRHLDSSTNPLDQPIWERDGETLLNTSKEVGHPAGWLDMAQCGVPNLLYKAHQPKTAHLSNPQLSGRRETEEQAT